MIEIAWSWNWLQRQVRHADEWNETIKRRDAIEWRENKLLKNKCEACEYRISIKIL